MSGASLPDMNGSTLYITSDYSGYHRKSKYEVISLLFVDIDNSKHWEYSRRCARNHFLSDGRRISFKGMNDRLQYVALPAFLESANNITGICVNIIVRKSIRMDYWDKIGNNPIAVPSPFVGKWRPKPFNRMFRVVHLVSVFIAGFVRPGQNVYWISDEDQIFANARMSTDVARLLSAFTDMYVDHNLGELGIGTTSLDEGDLFNEDLASIPDLTAGALAEYMTAVCKMCGGRIAGGLAYPNPKGITEKTEHIFCWLMDNTTKLKRLILLFESNGENKFSLTRVYIE